MWLGTHRRFAGNVVDWSHYEEIEAYWWHRKPHPFVTPLYYIEYGIALAGAFQLWVKAKTDPAGALEGYKQALRLGGSRPLPELFDAAGIRFDFSAETIGGLMEVIQQELASL